MADAGNLNSDQNEGSPETRDALDVGPTAAGLANADAEGVHASDVHSVDVNIVDSTGVIVLGIVNIVLVVAFLRLLARYREQLEALANGSNVDRAGVAEVESYAD